jgi:hypothetical protein
MGMYDEVYCYAALPDGRDPRGTCFQTKSFPDPCMCRCRITSAGRLIDSANNDLERIASDTAWLRFGGSIRLRFSSTIRTKSPTQVRLTLGLGSRGPGLVSNYFGTDMMSRFAG